MGLPCLQRNTLDVENLGGGARTAALRVTPEQQLDLLHALLVSGVKYVR